MSPLVLACFFCLCFLCFFCFLDLLLAFCFLCLAAGSPGPAKVALPAVDSEGGGATEPWQASALGQGFSGGGFWEARPPPTLAS
jgi:hypothetical protein